MPFAGVRVSGLRDLERAFARFGEHEKRELTLGLALAAEPVRKRAEELADENIRNIGPEWSAMRTGVTTKLVYVAPRHRRAGRPGYVRPNLAPLLMDRAMSPALEENEPHVAELIDQMLGRLGEEWQAA